MVRGRLFVPVHWGTFDLANHNWTEPAERAIRAADIHGEPIAVPRPGGSIDPAFAPKLARWWPKVPWQTAEEAPIISSVYEPKVAASSERGSVRGL